MEIEKPLGLTWGENRKREPGQTHIEWHAPCGCAFHPTPFPHVHPCTDEHKRPDLNIVTAARPSTSAAIRAAAPIIEQAARDVVNELLNVPRFIRNPESTIIEIEKHVAAILSRWFGKGKTESGESMNRVTFGSPVGLAAPDNVACPRCGGTKPTCCSCPDQPANKFVQEFTQAAIEAHVGYQHEARWHECGYAKCVERREMIIALYDATPAAPSPGEPRDQCEHGISLDEECLTCENQQDEINVARTSVEGESE